MTESWDVIYERIRLRFSAAVGGWVDSLFVDLDALAEAPETVGGLSGLFRKLHDLSGSSGTYGMHGVSTRAADGVMVCRFALDRDGVLSEAEIRRLRELLEGIRQELLAHPDVPRKEQADTQGGAPPVPEEST